MAKTLVRKLLLPFGINGNTTYFAQFGSLVAGSPQKTKDVTIIQNLPAWSDGLQEAVYGANKAPLLEDFNALLYVFGYQIAYALQEGVPEWDSTTTYYTGSYVKKAGTSQVYVSLIDSNLNNALPSQVSNSNWQYMVFMGVTSAPAGSVADSAIVSVSGSKITGSLPAGFVVDGNIVGLSAPKISGQLTNAQIASLSSTKLSGSIPAGLVIGSSISDGSVTTSKIGDGQVTAAKLASGALKSISGPQVNSLAVAQQDGLVDVSGMTTPGILLGLGFDSGSVFANPGGTVNMSVTIDGTVYNAPAVTLSNGANQKCYFQISRSGISLSTAPGVPIMYKSQCLLKCQITGGGDGRNSVNAYDVVEDSH